jgi:hypothetical protein
MSQVPSSESFSGKDHNSPEAAVVVADEPEERIVGEKPTNEEVFYVAWGEEIVKRSPQFTNEVFRQLVTLNVALLGGSFFLNIDPGGARTLLFALLLPALLLSFLGMMPMIGKIPLGYPYQIKAMLNRAQYFRIYTRWDTPRNEPSRPPCHPTSPFDASVDGIADWRNCECTQVRRTEAFRTISRIATFFQPSLRIR